MSSGLDSIYARLGDQAVYQELDTTQTSCTVVEEKDLSSYGDVASISGMTAVLSIRASEISDRPRREETFTMSVSGQVYVVDSVISSDGFEHRCLVA